MNGEQSAVFFFFVNILGLYISSGWFRILGQVSIQFLVQLSCKLDQSCRIHWEPEFQKSPSLRKKKGEMHIYEPFVISFIKNTHIRFT